MSSLSGSPNTIRLKSRVAVEVDESANSLLVVGSDSEPNPHRLETLETLSYCDHDLVASATSVVPALRFDELVETQALSPAALGLPPEAFRRPPARSELEDRLLRAFDVVVASIGLVITAPISLLVAIAVFVDSGGPVFYGSDRIGRSQPMFRAWKFRSMRHESQEVLTELLASDPKARCEYESYHKLRNDPRLTRVGGFIRRTSLDEIPQLWNVLRGEMSIIGPRPKLPIDAASYGPALDTVLSVRPGLTGLWQVSGRNKLTLHERVLIDVHYVHNRTFRNDLWICARTVAILCRPGRHGAY